MSHPSRNQLNQFNAWLDGIVSGDGDTAGTDDPELDSIEDTVRAMRTRSAQEGINNGRPPGWEEIMAMMARSTDAAAPRIPSLPIGGRTFNWTTVMRAVGAVVLIVMSAGFWFDSNGMGLFDRDDPPATLSFAGVSDPSASPVVIGDCVGLPPLRSREELMNMDVEDFPERSYVATGVADEETTVALYTQLHEFFSCDMGLDPWLSQEETNIMMTYSDSLNSDRARYFQIYPGRELRANAAMCPSRSDQVLAGIPIEANRQPNDPPPVYPATPEAFETWLTTDAPPVYELADGRFAIVDGQVSQEALDDPSKAAEQDNLWFTAYVKVGDFFYEDEGFGIEPYSEENWRNIPTTNLPEPCESSPATPEAGQ